MSEKQDHENIEEFETYHDGENPASDSQSEDDAAILQTRIIELEQEIEAVKDKALRALADAENTKRRVEREKEDTAKFAVSRFAKDLLEVADNMRRALDAIPQDQKDSNELVKNIVIGIEATEKSLHASFQKNGIEIIAPQDGKFDPHMHEAMFEAEIDGKSPGDIIQLIEQGYALNGRLLRPARVGVAKGSTSKAQEVDQSA